MKAVKVLLTSLIISIASATYVPVSTQ